MKTLLKIIIKHVLAPIGSVLLFLAYYGELSKSINGVEYGLLRDIKLEIAFSLIIYYALFFALKDNWKRYFYAILPMVIFYGFYDFYFLSFGKIFKICDVTELPELVDVLPWWQLIFYLSVFILPFLIVIANFSRAWIRWLNPSAVLLMAIFLTNFKPEMYLSLFNAYSTFGVTYWSDKNTALNGYFSSTLFFEAMMVNDKNIANELYGDGSAFEKPTEDIAQFLAGEGNNRNIHIIVLEGFINPELLTKVRFSSATYHKDFSTLIGNKESALISPVFGGYTAEAEFEILCGVPALHKYSSIEFNSFTKNPTFCLPAILDKSGYRTVVSNGFKPNFFNEDNAYQGVGFKEVYFPRQYAPQRSTYFALIDDMEFMFDGDLLSQNIEFLKTHLADVDRKPILNYVLGMYGHSPFELDEKRHPMFISATRNKSQVSDELDRVANQTYYRTQALAIYLKQLVALDPDSLIVVTGDHLPRLGGTRFYRKLGWRNRIDEAVYQPSAFFIVDGKVVKKDTIYQFDVINTVYNYLTNRKYCKVHECKRSSETLDYQYNMIMARALR